MNFRLLPEWAEQDAVMLTWPHKDTDWADNLARVEPVYIELAKHITTQQQLVIVAHNSALKVHITALLNSANVSLNRVHFVVTPTNDTWARDHGPLTCAAIDSPKQLKVYDFTFNGWGNKFESALDNQINRTLVKELSSTTSECLLNKNRNPDLNPNDIEALLKEHLGATSFLWVEHGYLAGDDTDSHIDTLVRFAPNNTLVYVQCDDKTDEHFSALDAMEKQLKTFKTADNTPYNLIELPWPKAAYDDEQTRLPATYANYLIINNAVLVPTYNDANDERALAQVQKAYPQHTIIGVNCQPIIEQFGSLHCITMQLPRGFLAGAAQ